MNRGGPVVSSTVRDLQSFRPAAAQRMISYPFVAEISLASLQVSLPCLHHAQPQVIITTVVRTKGGGNRSHEREPAPGDAPANCPDVPPWMKAIMILGG